MRKLSQSPEPAVLERDQLQWLLDALVNRGYRVLGPTVRDQAIGYDAPPPPKKFLPPAVVRLWGAKAGGNGFQLEEGAEEAAKLAFIGVRSCELHAIAVQDKVFLDGKYSDPVYKARRQANFLVAGNCGPAGG